MEIEFENAKKRVTELIDEWSEEVINDLLNEIKSYCEQKNINDIELTMDSIREVQRQAFDIKQKVLRSYTTQQVFSVLNFEFF